ncbi:MAG: hypothetical protein J6U74_01625 [Clostridia bacterium]|nr:hypothetical protein [Clostridia bacterium]
MPKATEGESEMNSFRQGTALPPPSKMEAMKMKIEIGLRLMKHCSAMM